MRPRLPVNLTFTMVIWAVTLERWVGGGTLAFTGFLLVNDCNDISDCMSSITIRNLESNVKDRLRLRAARHGRSMEAEARDILRAALAEKTRRPTNLFEAIRRRIDSLGGVELDIPARSPLREPPRFEE